MAVDDYKVTKNMSDTQKMVRLSRWEKVKADQGIVWSDWMREIACRYYKKRQGMAASKEFASYMEELAEYIRDEKRGEDQLSTFKVTGDNAISAAYRKVFNALINNLDITDYNKYKSLNAIADANKEANIKKKEAEEAKQLEEERDYSIQCSLEEKGLEPGTEEFEKEFKQIKDEASMVLIQGGKDEEEEESEPDHVSELLSKLEVKLRAMEQAGYNEESLDTKVNVVIHQWDNYITSAVKGAAKSAVKAVS